MPKCSNDEKSVLGFSSPLKGDVYNNRPFAVGGHVTTAILNQSAMTKWHPELESAGRH